MSEGGDIMIPGRTCPIDYNLNGESFDRFDEDIMADTIYVVGGLYGNKEALDEILKMAKEESNLRIVFNGDAHWFDVDLEDFSYIENAIKNYDAIIGNVEAELISDRSEAGCGCSYPDSVDDGVVDRSNKIHSIMKKNIQKSKDMIDVLKRRKRTLTARVGDKRIAILHGDEKSLAGWGNSKENLQDADRLDEIGSWADKNSIDIVACTHTCAPIAVAFGEDCKTIDENNGEKRPDKTSDKILDVGEVDKLDKKVDKLDKEVDKLDKPDKKVVINNGASGMPNFINTNYGLLTRISKTKSDRAIYRYILGDVFIEAIPIEYDHDKFLKWFDEVWDNTSPASISYRDRIVYGGCDNVENCVRGFELVFD